jgi:hypothetical protein
MWGRAFSTIYRSAKWRRWTLGGCIEGWNPSEETSSWALAMCHAQIKRRIGPILLELLSFKPESENENNCFQIFVRNAQSPNIQPKVAELDNELIIQRPKPDVKDHLENNKLMRVEPPAPYTKSVKWRRWTLRGCIKGWDPYNNNWSKFLKWAFGQSAAVYLHNRTPNSSGGRTIAFTHIQRCL